MRSFSCVGLELVNEERESRMEEGESMQKFSRDELSQQIVTTISPWFLVQLAIVPAADFSAG